MLTLECFLSYFPLPTPREEEWELQVNDQYYWTIWCTVGDLS